MRQLLMVRPTHFRVAYEINPWMHRRLAVEHEAAERQWDGLYRLLTGPLNAEVLLAEPQEGLPDLVFTANAGLVLGRRVILSHFRFQERQPEAAVFRAWFAAHGFEVEELPCDCFFEGEGDALIAGDTLFAGYHWRSDVNSHRMLSVALGVRVLSLELTDPYYYHLDTCFCPLDASTVIYHPPAFDEYARRVIEANFPRRIEVAPDEAARFACNAVVLGREVALNSGCPRLEADLRARGFTPHAVPLDEFLKAGGSAKCLTLHLDRSPVTTPGARERPEAWGAAAKPAASPTAPASRPAPC